MNEAEIKIMENISTYGCHVTSVFDPKNFTGPWSLSQKSTVVIQANKL